MTTYFTHESRGTPKLISLFLFVNVQILKIIRRGQFLFSRKRRVTTFLNVIKAYLHDATITHGSSLRQSYDMI